MIIVKQSQQSVFFQINSSLNSTRSFQLRKDCDVFLDSPLVKAIKIFAYSILMILSLCGNSLVIATIFRKPKLRTIVNLLILNLSASDLLMPLFAYTIRMKRIYEPRGLWPVDGVVGSMTCKLIPFAEFTSVIVSILTMEAIAVERFFSVVFPMKTQPINSKKSCSITITFVWLIGMSCCSLYFYTSKIIHKDTKPYCINTWEPAFVHAEAYKVQFTIALILFTMVFVLSTSLYSTIIISLHRQKGRIKLSSEQATRRNKKYKRIVYMLITVVAIFFLSWAPVNVYLFLSAFVWPTHRPCELRRIIFSAMFVAYSYPALNPFIYFTFNSEYRKSFQELLGFQKRPKASASNEVSATIMEDSIPNDVVSASSKAVVFLSIKPLDANSGSISVQPSQWIDVNKGSITV